jgi:hypothetical protein
MDAVSQELQAEIPQVEEESSWEVFSEDEFSESSEESTDEDSGDEILRHRSAKRRIVS